MDKRQRSLIKQGADPRRVFIVHGRNMKACEEVRQFLLSLRLDPRHGGGLATSATDSSAYVGQMVDDGFAQAMAVVVILTGDDEGRLRQRYCRPEDPPEERTTTPQPRLNVVFEAGRAFATHPGRTILVQLGRVRPFSDVQGRHVLHLDNSLEKRRAFIEKLKRAQCAVRDDNNDWAKAGDFLGAVADSEQGAVVDPDLNVTPPSRPSEAALGLLRQIADEEGSRAYVDVIIDRAPTHRSRVHAMLHELEEQGLIEWVQIADSDGMVCVSKSGHRAIVQLLDEQHGQPG